MDKRAKFWANLTDRQKDMRVLFFDSDNRLPRQEGAGAVPRHWVNLTDDQEQDRDKFFVAQEEPPKRPKSWTGITDDQDQERDKFFVAQGDPPEHPKSWTGITDEQDQDRDKFFASQEDQPKHWANLTDDRKQQRETFFASMNNPSGPGAAFWSQPGPGASTWDADLVFQFTVTAPALGLITGEFKSVRGLATDEWEYESYREGGDIGTEHLLPKYKKAGRLILERALRHPDPFVIWCLTMETGIMIRQPVTVTLLSNRVPAAMWIIPGCMPVKIEWSDLDAMTSEVATSTVELAHTGIIPIPM